MSGESGEQFNLNAVLMVALEDVVQRLVGIDERSLVGRAEEGDKEEAEGLNQARGFLESPDLFSSCTSKEGLRELVQGMADKESGLKKEGWEWVREFTKE